MRSLSLLTCAVISASASVAWAEQLTPASSVVKPVKPGGYFTLPFEFDGDGLYTFEITGPPGWNALSARKTLAVKGHATVPFSFKVPDLALLGLTPFTVTVNKGGQEVGRATARVEVQRRIAVGVRAPTQVNVPIGQIGRYPVTVTNLGNAPDTIRLRFDATPAGTLLAQDTFKLGPGESAQTTVILDRRSKRDNGATFLFGLNAVSEGDPDQAALAETGVTWGVGVSAENVARIDPQLTVQLGAGVVGSAQFGPSGSSFGLNYRLSADVSGDLSDYYTASASPSELAGSLDAPIPDVPSLRLGLKSDQWETSLNVGFSGVSGGGSFTWQGWRWSPQLGLGWGRGNLSYGAGLGASGPLGPGRLSARLGTSGVTGASASRTDSLLASYDVKLAPGWTLGVQPSAFGLTTAQGYVLQFGVGQNSSYQAEKFDVTESFASDLRSSHSLTVAGGLRDVSPFGVRGSLSAGLDPRGLSWNAAALLLALPGSGVAASLLGSYGSGPNGPTWALTPAASYGFGVGSVSTLIAAKYSLSRDELGLEHSAQLNLNVNAGRLQSSLTGRFDAGARLPQPQYGLDVRAGYLISADDLLTGQYSLDLGGLSNQSVEIGWTRVWSDQIQSSLGYSRAWGTGGTTEGVTAGLAWSGLGLDGLALATSYSLSAPNSLFAGNLSHKISLGLQYDTALTFGTPKSVVELFGGRRGGTVEGQLYRDENLNGVRESGERALGGVTVQIGSEQAVTDADGHYRLHVPPGTYGVQFPAGVPTTLAPLTPLNVQVVENGEYHLDAALAPVNSLDVSVFDDANNNKVLDAGEQPIPYVGAQVSGPVTRSLTADADGVVHFSGLPRGVYSVSLVSTKLPEGYRQTSDAASVTIGEQGKPDGVVLGAGQPPRQQAVTFTASNIALLATTSSASVAVGEDLTVQLFISGEVQDASVQVFGQTYTVEGSGPQRAVTFKVPTGTAPGDYPVQIKVSGPGGSRETTLQVSVP